MPLEAKKLDASDLAADFASLAQKSKKAPEGEGPAPVERPRPSLRGSLSGRAEADPEDERIAAIADKVARGHSGFTGVNDRLPEKIDMERLTLAIPSATGADLAVKAARARVTKTFLLLKALKDAGFEVPDAALIPDGRARR